jgi:heme/copper-type cytochrome/quinol oxidase subunit 2
VATFHLTFWVNTLGHLIGSRRYPTPDHSRNSFLLALIKFAVVVVFVAMIVIIALAIYRDRSRRKREAAEA